MSQRFIGQQAVLGVLVAGSFCLAAAAGCGGADRGGTEVKLDDGIKVRAPGVDVDVDREGVKVKAPGVNVDVGDE